MKAAEPGSFDIVAGHIQGLEVDKGTLTIRDDGAWLADITLSDNQVSPTEAESQVTLLGDLFAWSGHARIAASAAGVLNLIGVGSLAVQPAVGA